MSGSNRDKAANRAGMYKTGIAAAQAEGDHRRALHLAERWLLSEAARAARQRPADAALMYREVVHRLAQLAEALPFYRPAKAQKGGSDGRAA